MPRPNILMITSDEERYVLPQPEGSVLPARARRQQRGVTVTGYCAASAQRSSSRSVIYTRQHTPITEISDNDSLPYIHPLDPAFGTLGTMLRSAWNYWSFQGNWHLSRLYKDPSDPTSTTDALEPYVLPDWNDWGDIDGGAWAGLKIDPVIAGQAVRRLRDRAPVQSQDQPWLLAGNFVNPRDTMSYNWRPAPGAAAPNLEEAMVVRPRARNLDDQLTDRHQNTYRDGDLPHIAYAANVGYLAPDEENGRDLGPSKVFLEAFPDL